MNSHSYNSKELLKILLNDGWKVIRIKGSHHQLRHPRKDGLVTIPHPKKNLPRKTIESILKQAGLKKFS